MLLGEQLGSAGLSECASHPASLHQNHLDVCSQVHPRAKPYIDSQNSPKTLTTQNMAAERLRLAGISREMNHFWKLSAHPYIQT